MGAEPTRRREWPAGLSPRADLIDTLNSWWRVAGPPPHGGTSVKRRLAYPFRRLLARILGPQETFNSAVVQYINGTTTWHQAMVDAMASTIEQCETAIDAALREREALAARERRVEAAMSTIRAAHDELRLSVGVLQQATRTLTHEMARLRQEAHGTSPGPRGHADEQIPSSAAQDETRHGTAAHVEDDALGHKYVGFEDQYRGSAEAVRERLADYVPLFASAADVLEIGCGRGEFLALLAEHGIGARGVDSNAAMVQVCRDKGLRADVGDALAVLREQPDQSLGGLFAAQVVEHLEPSYLAALLDAAFDKLRPGAVIVLETINPACWFAFFESYIRDITHVRPLHPETLTYLLVATGFQRVEVRYRVPYPQHQKLQPIAPNATLGDSVETLNANVEKINRLLFTFLDYAAVGYRP